MICYEEAAHTIWPDVREWPSAGRTYLAQSGPDALLAKATELEAQADQIERQHKT
ncbi:hypothetical protein RSO01_25090 [Reyranella soli]|uniref:Uncharacterized protein n=1 Tax=Reyranella soli TaxID=1230389 RepID=A0A512N8V0_9HYPH|nr:hypothetical protein RSO01_25090 [Reyranella soli]